MKAAGELLRIAYELLSSRLGWTEHWAGKDVIVSSSLLEALEDTIGTTMFGKSLTSGKPRECQENARIEYWAQKEAGKKPLYVVGRMMHIHKREVVKYAEFFGETPSKEEVMHNLPLAIEHVWVQMEGSSKVIDPTLFIAGTGGGTYLADEVMFARYVPKVIIGEDQDGVLLEPLRLPYEAVRRLQK